MLFIMYVPNQNKAFIIIIIINDLNLRMIMK